MKACNRTPSRLVSGPLMALMPILAGCGHRGAPLPPVYPNPPPITGLIVAQRGSLGIMKFALPELSETIGGQDVELESIQVLVYAERYAVLNVAMLIDGLKRHREVMIQDAKAEAAAAGVRSYLAMVEMILGFDAGVSQPPSDDPEVPVTTARRRTLDEDAIHRVPKEILLQWEHQGLAADGILQSARQLADAVQVLWNTLGLPTSILDPLRPPPPLPSAGESIWYESVIGAVSKPLLRAQSYERPLQVNDFLGRAAVSREVPVDQFDELVSIVEPPLTPRNYYSPPVLPDEILQVAVPLGTPAPGDLRTRYFFAVRSKSTQKIPGEVATVVSLAPVPVPVTPTSLTVTISASGVGLAWDPSTADLLLRRVDPKTLTYNVYRMLPEGIAGPTPLNPTPLLQPTYTDGTVQWGETYLYEVRAMLERSPLPPPPRPPTPESGGVKTGPIEVIDKYRPAPPINVSLTRADNIVTLEWTPSTSIDIVGYRVYRHPYPAPAVPQRLDPPLEVPRPGETPVAQGPVAQETEELNEMVEAGWKLITDDLVMFSRTFDNNADPAVRYVYAVEAIDAAGNLSSLATESETEDRNR